MGSNKSDGVNYSIQNPTQKYVDSEKTVRGERGLNTNTTLPEAIRSANNHCKATKLNKKKTQYNIICLNNIKVSYIKTHLK